MPFDIFTNRKDVARIVSTEIELHPLARPVDMYKLLIQAAYGPGHLISSIDQVINSIVSEMHDVPEFDENPCQDLDAGFGYVRYHLANLNKYRKQPEQLLINIAEELAKAMIKSCDIPGQQPNFLLLWYANLPLIKSMISAPIEEWEYVQHLAAGNLIPSHSAMYKTAYQPHYRVLKKKYLNI